MRFAELLGAPGLLAGPLRGGGTVPDAAIAGVTADSRRVAPGWLFVAVAGARSDGHDFLEEAARRGAAMALVDRVWLEERSEVAFPLPVLGVVDPRGALAFAADAFYGHPSRALAVVGVTGTNGKTTVTHLVASLLEDLGTPCGIMGTLGARIGGELAATGHTTPPAPELHALFARMRDLGMRAAAIEVSSHAIDQERVRGARLAVAAFTNLSQDHLDYHGTMQAYGEAKARLFGAEATGTAPRHGVVNLDDGEATTMLATAAAAGVPVIGYTLEAQGAAGGEAGQGGHSKLEGPPVPEGAPVLEGVPATPLSLRTLRALSLRCGVVESRFALVWGGERREVKLPLGGRFNVANAACAAACALALGHPLAAVAEALGRVSPVPGRLQPVSPPDHPFAVLVDYAHTPDGLEQVLGTVKAAVRGRVIAVFGCGGDRDRAKRPLMGAVAARLADFAVVTSDNPRGEEPAVIASEITAGMPAGGAWELELDRAAAIARAIAVARPDDAVVIAGKGHEAYQIFATRTVPFDDAAVARAALAPPLARAREGGAAC